MKILFLFFLFLFANGQSPSPSPTLGPLVLSGRQMLTEGVSVPYDMSGFQEFFIEVDVEDAFVYGPSTNANFKGAFVSKYKESNPYDHCFALGLNNYSRSETKVVGCREGDYVDETCLISTIFIGGGRHVYGMSYNVTHLNIYRDGMSIKSTINIEENNGCEYQNNIGLSVGGAFNSGGYIDYCLNGKYYGLNIWSSYNKAYGSHTANFTFVSYGANSFTNTAPFGFGENLFLVTHPYNMDWYG